MLTGRFAPSPTGPLHFGSLVAAVASYCDIKSRGGQWLLRIEDVDQTRSVTGASEEIIRTLHRYGFVWDGEILYQSQRSQLYQAALDQLIAQAQAYPCTCSRKEIADSSTLQGIEGAIYPGTCLKHPLKASTLPAWRMRVDELEISFEDQLQGRIQHQLSQQVGDFVLKRADGLFSYQLAVVMDDALQGVTHVVRGADLLNSTSRQLYLQQVLGLPTPVYAHIPLVMNDDGQKLSKQNLASSIANAPVLTTLLAALEFLGRTPQAPCNIKDSHELLDWAALHWQPY